MTEPVVSGPVRVQLSRGKGWKMPPNTVKVDRTTGWGNPFPVSKGTSTSQGVTTPTWMVGTFEGPGLWFCPDKEAAQALAVKAYRACASPSLVERAQHQLCGKNLACWCRVGTPCHADVLLEIANAEPGQ